MKRILLFCALPTVCAALEWTNQPGYRSAEVRPAAPGRTGFQVMTPEVTGVSFTNHIPPQRHYTNQILLNGSGVAAGDVDGDGWCDLFFAGLGGGSALYGNRGDWKFENVTAASGLGHLRDGKIDATGAALVDLDGDGDLDLVVNSVGQGTFCFWNDGHGHFSSPVTLNQGRCGSSLAFGDVDGDGTLDLYIANYRTSTIRDQPGAGFSFKTVNGRPEPISFGGRALTEPDLTNRFAFVYRPRAQAGAGGSVFHDELGEPDALYRNAGASRFAAIPFTGGAFLDEAGKPLAQPLLDWGLSVMMRDFNGDGAPDIYVCNDFATPDRFWLNDGKGKFRAAPASAIRQTSLSTMAIDVADINRDGFDDIFTADMLSRERWRRLVQRNEANANIHLFVDVARQPQSSRNALQLARGDGTYAEIAQLAGLEAAEWAWASIFLDVDLDGYEDLLVANGFERDYMNMDANRKINAFKARGGKQMPVSEQLALSRFYPRLDTANAAFRNLGNLRFADVSAEWGFDVHAVSQGMCLADLDNDGDLDVIINNSNGAATLLRNETAAPRVAVRLKGKSPNTRGIGARIKLVQNGKPAQSQEMISGGRYLSSDDPMRVFAAGSQMSLEVIWRNGARSLVTNAIANRIYEIDEASSTRGSGGVPPAKPPMFKDVSGLLNHTNTQAPFDDFARQPLLPNKLSTPGPGLSWFDFDGDGWDDLIAGMAVFRNDGRGRFTAESPAPRTHTTVLGYRTPQGEATLLAGSSNYEGLTNAPIAQQYGLAGAIRELPQTFPPSAVSTGPLALADLNGGGKLTLFIGGRCVPGRWPQAAPSFLFRQTDGKWLLDQENTKVLTNIGMVSGAVFTDLSGDGYPELVLACEWGPLRIFRNERGKLVPWSPEVQTPNSEPKTLSDYTGWWNGVTTGDFDGDGRMDLIASNWGRNTKYERYRSKPLRIYYGDFNGDRGVGLIESVYDDALRNYAPILNVWTISRSMPWLLEKFGSYEAFSRASVEQALGDRGRHAEYLEAAWLDSTVFLNRGDHFEARPLPIDAQTAPAFGVCVADFDGDGNEDVFLSQNFFGTRPETSRYDAGRGLLLRGDGHGGFAAVSGQESGVMIYGEQRAAAVADYDQDGRTDLVVTQFGGETKLYRNETARPGLRVRMRSPVGAVIRLKFGERLGPAREIHAGSGYWSQDSAVEVMAVPQMPTAIQVRWPGGKVVEAPVPSGATEISIDASGKMVATGKK